MRTILILAASAALFGAATANAQEPSMQQQPTTPPATSQTAPSASPTIKSISVVDISELPPETQTRVNEVVAKRTSADAERLQSTIDAAPDVKSALEAKGSSSKEVVAMSLSDEGVLTLITKKNS